MLKKNNRKYYEKPRINNVKLEIEEAVLAGCKVGLAQPGKNGRRCNSTPCKKTYGS